MENSFTVNIKVQYQILGQLKRVDDKVVRIQRDIDKIPAEMQKIEGAIAAKRSELTQLKTKLDVTEKGVRKLEADLKEKDDQLKKAEAKLMEVKNNEEYQAATKENEAQKKLKGGLEEMVLKSISELDELKKKYAESEAGFKDYESTLSKDLNVLKQELDKLNAEYSEQIKVRESTASGLEPAISVLYTRASMRGAAYGVVAVVDNCQCLSCNMKVRPQLYNEILGFKAIHRCPNCGRLLVTPAINAENEAAS